MLTQRAVRPVHGIGLGQRRGCDPLLRRLSLLRLAAHQVVVLLAGGVRSHDQKVAGRVDPLVAAAGGQNRHVAGLHGMHRSLRPAELNLGAAGADTQHFMGVAVEMVVREDSVAPRATPTVLRE